MNNVPRTVLVIGLLAGLLPLVLGQGCPTEVVPTDTGDDLTSLETGNRRGLQYPRDHHSSH